MDRFSLPCQIHESRSLKELATLFPPGIELVFLKALTRS